MPVTAEQSILTPAPAGHAAREERLAAHPYRASLFVMIAGYLLLTGILLGIGLLLTHALDGSVGRWDQNVNELFARHRTAFWNDVTGIATAAFNTVPVVVAASVVVGLLAIRRRWSEAAFLTLSLLIEITVFLSVTFVVARPRPAVHRLNSTPATSSFPSGHTAAATVLFVGIALIVTCCTRSQLARVGSSLVAAVVSVAVGFSRVYRGLHHPTDVFVGLLFGLACLLVAALAVRAARRRIDRVDERVLRREPTMSGDRLRRIA
jgi:undecaprenyl-diphosphatase